ncbi:hypothetical protein GCM10010212_20540 [Paenarthrobacter nicotinovorans]|nr:hypothetical protein [Paenarthrobacter nicotinovorans]MBP2393487.1 hypothetical protein [Paenarthrobacter nicotinovorans]UKF00256.1 hypothetical protein LU808_05465 [Paenarthrobacter nicotinovorans]UKF05038.1 hypothetical protein JMY29_05490 [Paenarthrobacter nicotinovorans]GGV32727.1 hypothetical protein GCM10010212_20540 [Paenarthrobacter nicotinovorans]
MLHYVFGDGPQISGAKAVLFVAWPAFSRSQIVISVAGPSVPWFAAWDRLFWVQRGAPTYD